MQVVQSRRPLHVVRVESRARITPCPARLRIRTPVHVRTSKVARGDYLFSNRVLVSRAIYAQKCKAGLK